MFDVITLARSSAKKKTHRHFFFPSSSRSCRNPHRCISSECPASVCPNLLSAVIMKRKEINPCSKREGLNIGLVGTHQETYIWSWAARSGFLASGSAVLNFQDEEQSHQQQTFPHFFLIHHLCENIWSCSSVHFALGSNIPKHCLLIREPTDA